MKLEIKSNNLFNYFKNTYLFFLVFTILFGRSFTGVYILGFRIGELMIAACMLLSIYFLIVLVIFSFDRISKSIFFRKSAIYIYRIFTKKIYKFIKLRIR